MNYLAVQVIPQYQCGRYFRLAVRFDNAADAEAFAQSKNNEYALGYASIDAYLNDPEAQGVTVIREDRLSFEFDDDDIDVDIVEGF